MRNGVPIREHFLKQKVNSGITVDSLPGIVSEYESREACTFCNYNYMQWLELDSIERAFCVAQYRIHNLIEAHVSDAADKESERRGRRHSKR